MQRMNFKRLRSPFLKIFLENEIIHELFHSQDLICNSPIHCIICYTNLMLLVVRRFGIGSTVNLLLNIFLYSHHLIVCLILY